MRTELPSPRLGFGYMRLPRINGRFDRETVNEMVDIFLSYGFTFFDTAYVYEGAEEALRESLVKRYRRDRFEIATKLSIAGLSDGEQQREQFETSMERLGVDYLDYYLIHELSGVTIQKAYDMRTWEFVKSLKRRGLVKKIGFSFHGTADQLREIFRKNPDMEFVYLQINYLDWEDGRVQSRLCYEAARAFGKPIIVMEPAKGGLLAGNRSVGAQLLKKANPNVSAASWAYRYAGGLQGVTTVLSGMETVDQIKDNARTFRNFTPLSHEEREWIARAVCSIKAVPMIQCTGCRYCVSECPRAIKIPEFIGVYNDILRHKAMRSIKFQYGIMTMGESTKAGHCTKCRRCEERCPQHIAISDILQELTEKLEHPADGCRNEAVP